MTVIFYDKGEHAAGFTGFRVARTIGTAKELRQSYISLSEHGYEKAKQIAQELDAKWEAEAEAAKITIGLAQRNPSWKPNIIISGLRAYIDANKRKRDGVSVMLFEPSFHVKTKGYGKGDHIYRVTVYGYQKAYELAAAKYTEIHGLSASQHQELLSKTPDRSVFTGYLLDGLHDRGLSVTKEEIALALSL